MTEAIRLSKRVAEQVPCSRREAEQYIEGGWVLVDGQVVDEPQFRVLQQTIELHPDATLTPIEPVTLLLHKPAGCDVDEVLQLITTATRTPDDRSGIRTLKRHFSKLTQTVPLNTDISGLVVFTQDWRIARKLISDIAKIEQEYIVEVAGELPAEGLALLNHGLRFRNRELPPIKVSWQNETRLRFALKGVQHGQIAHMCESVGLTVLAIKRIRVGRVPMASLAVGQWRYLYGYEKF
jgi:23S rRNA pseudouridine2604 synthase